MGWEYTSPGGGAGGGGVTIGDTVGGVAVNDAVLYVDSSGNVANSANFKWAGGVEIIPPGTTDIPISISVPALQSGVILYTENDSVQTATINAKGQFTHNVAGLTNEAFGTGALSAITTGQFNTGIGYQALFKNEDGNYNFGIGHRALRENIDGDYNVAVGSDAMYNNTSGNQNVGIGYISLTNNLTGLRNVAVGGYSLTASQSGNDNTAIGGYALAGLIIGSNNVAVGYRAGYSNTGSGSVFVGFNAGFNETSSNKLYIANSSTATPLIGGDFSGETVNIQGATTITAPTISQEPLRLVAGGTQAADMFVTEVGGAVCASITEEGNFTNSRGKAGCEFFGSLAGSLAPTGAANTGVGWAALNLVSAGLNNTGVGYHALASVTTGDYNTAVGMNALEKTTGNNNTGLGYRAGQNIVGGINNTFVGGEAGASIVSTSNNTAVGYDALPVSTSSVASTAIGMRSLWKNTSGSFNTALGAGAGENNVSGASNVFLGYQAGYNETGSNKLYISNSNTATPLIHGDFSTDVLTINGTQTITNAASDGLTIRSTGTGSRSGLVCDNDGSVQFQFFMGGSLHGVYPNKAALVLDDGVPLVIAHTSATPRFSVDEDGNVLVGTITQPSANSGDMLIFKAKSSTPTMGTDTAGIFGESDGGNVRMKAIDEDGVEKYLTGAYGEIRAESNATTTTFSDSSTDFSNKVQIVIFDTNGISRGTTPDHTNDHITIDEDGDYNLRADVSFSGGNSNTLSFAIFKNNGATQLTTRATRKLGTGGDVGNAGISGQATLSATDTVELWIQNELNTTAITVEDVTLSISKI